jgi:CubicO group peptidase (beta-lactamase class C family)
MTAAAQALPAALLPVSVARNGFTPEQARSLRDRYSYVEVISAGDVSLFHFLNLNVWLPTAQIARTGNVVPLRVEPDPRFGATRIKGAGPTLNDYLLSPASRAQGMVVVHRGRVVLERYPGMRDTDSHVWMSTAKTTTSLVVRLLAEQGRIDVKQPIDRYMPALKGTAWEGTRVQEVLDMASGMDVVETQNNRENPRSLITRYNLATSGEANADGVKESQFEVIRTAKRLRPAGEVFDYSSVNTTLLALLAEAVENKRWSDIFQERVWSKMTVEGDMLVALAPDSTPQSHGLVATRLRDLARYGMLYTPSWKRAARERIVSDAYVHSIQAGGRKKIFAGGEIGDAMKTLYFPSDPPNANSWQWDGVWDDGDFYKGGVYGQGLYVSPRHDLVIVWFSTGMKSDLPDFARQIANDLSKRR